MLTPADYLPLYETTTQSTPINNSEENKNSEVKKKFKKPDASKLVTIPQHLLSLELNRSLPSVNTIKPYIARAFKDKTNSINLKKSIAQSIICQFFILSFFIEVIVFFIYRADPDLRWQERATDMLKTAVRCLGILIAYSLNINTGGAGFWQAWTVRDSGQQNTEQLANYYAHYQEKLLHNHMLEKNFFTICHHLAHLNKLESENVDLVLLGFIETDLTNLFGELNLAPEQIFGFLYQHDNKPQNKEKLIASMKDLLLSNIFTDIIEEIKSELSRSFNELKFFNSLNVNPKAFRDDFDDLLNRHAGLLSTVLDIIAEESIKNHSETSRTVYRKVEFLNVSLPKILKEALVYFWLESPSDLDNLSKVNTKTLAQSVITKLHQRAPGYLIEAGSDVMPLEPNSRVTSLKLLPAVCETASYRGATIVRGC